MHFLFGGLFWGILLVLLGLTIILKAVFKIDIPLFRMVFALLIIYWGLKLLFGGSFLGSSGNTVIFSESKIESKEAGNEYNIVFGKSTIDLTDIDISESGAVMEVNVVFGSGYILINPEIPTLIKVSTVFAESKLPKGNVSFFGDRTYKTKSYVDGENHLKLNIDVVFGNAIIEDKWEKN